MTGVEPSSSRGTPGPDLAAATVALLGLIVDRAPLKTILTTLAGAVEKSTPDTHCSILLLDGAVLHHGAGPSLAPSYRDEIDGVRIGPRVGSCGTAAYLREPVIVSDIATDPLWTDYRGAALQAGLRACWSVPIIDREGAVLGTFALYYGEVRSPKVDDLTRLAHWVNLAEVAIGRAREVVALHDAATQDRLTGLPNRGQLQRELRLAIDGGADFAVIFVDLDQFKLVNDTVGHSGGDRFLQAAASRLVDCVGPGNTVGRYGGDEFVVLHRSVAERSDLELLGRRIVAAMQRPLSVYGRTLALSASVGITVRRPGGHPTADLIGDADLAMYTAKRSGRGSVAFFADEMRREAAAGIILDGELGSALAKGEIDCAYQPIVDLTDGRLVAVEALLRWTSPTRGVVPPTSVIAAAEASGRILLVGQVILDRACRQLSRWRDGHRVADDVVLGVNVSARQLQHPGFADAVRRTLAETRLPATNLGLEITESAFIENAGPARSTLRCLREMGVQISVDDFGTGYSSLAQLKNLPVDVLKVDRQFVCEIASDVVDAGIVQAIVTLAATLGLTVVAEGVETEPQRRKLVELGIRYGQGYLFSAAVPADEFRAGSGRI